MFNYTKQKLDTKLNLYELHTTLKNINSMEDLSLYYIQYICDNLNIIKKNGINNNQKYLYYSKYDYTRLCPSPCKKERCDEIQYAIKGSCEDLPDALYSENFKCSCSSPWVWNQALKLCEEPNFKKECDKKKQ